MGSVSVLLDTHALLWWWSHPDRLTDRARDLIADPYSAVCVSAASASEISTKHRIGKLPSGGAIIDTWDERLSRDRFSEIAVTSKHAILAGRIESDHRDPFDRVIAAQGMIELLPVVTIDEAFDALGATRVWD